MANFKAVLSPLIFMEKRKVLKILSLWTLFLLISQRVLRTERWMLIGGGGVILFIAAVGEQTKRHQVLNISLPLSRGVIIKKIGVKRSPACILCFEASTSTISSAKVARNISALGVSAVDWRPRRWAGGSVLDLYSEIDREVRSRVVIQGMSINWIAYGGAIKSLIEYSAERQTMERSRLVLVDGDWVRLASDLEWLPLRANGAQPSSVLLLCSDQAAEDALNLIKLLEARGFSRCELATYAPSEKGVVLSISRFVGEAVCRMEGSAPTFEEDHRTWFRWAAVLALAGGVVLWLVSISRKLVFIYIGIVGSFCALGGLLVVVPIGSIRTDVWVRMPLIGMFLAGNESGARFNWLADKFPEMLLSEAMLHVTYTKRLPKYSGPSLSESEFRDFILSPCIAETCEVGTWRASMWKTLYPRVRLVSDAKEAAEIVADAVRSRICEVDRLESRFMVNEMWTRQVADISHWDRLYLCSLRSVGVASRLCSSGVEFIYCGEWHRAPPCPALKYLVRND
jgi:hypothetical protein